MYLGLPDLDPEGRDHAEQFEDALQLNLLQIQSQLEHDVTLQYYESGFEARAEVAADSQ